MSLRIKDRRWLVAIDTNEQYSDTDREMWLNALGADDIRWLVATSSGNVLLVHFTSEQVNLRTINSAFGYPIEVVMKGFPSGTLIGSDIRNVLVPIYAIEELKLTSSPI